MVLAALTAAAVAFGGGALLWRGVGQPAGAADTLPDWATTPAVHPVAAPAAEVDPDPPVGTITLAFGGDVHGEPPIADVLAAGGNPLAGVQEVLSAADLAIVNLETAVGELGAPADKQYTFQADPSLVAALAEAGVDAASMANNHALDFGAEAAAETRDHLADAGLVPLGYGDDEAAAYAPWRTEVRGHDVAVLGLTGVMPWIEWGAGEDRPGMAHTYDADRAVQAVRDAAEGADHVVVVVHWGRERQACPDAAQVVLANRFREAGADVVVGHHPHVLQGVVEDGATLVAYSIGNFVFYAEADEARDTGVLTVTLDAEGVVDHQWHPARIDEQGRPQPAAGPTSLASADGCRPADG